MPAKFPEKLPLRVTFPAPALMVSAPLPLPPPLNWRVPESPAMVPVLFTGIEIEAMPEPADLSRIPALLNDVPVCAVAVLQGRVGLEVEGCPRLVVDRRAGVRVDRCPCR